MVRSHGIVLPSPEFEDYFDTVVCVEVLTFDEFIMEFAIEDHDVIFSLELPGAMYSVLISPHRKPSWTLVVENSKLLSVRMLLGAPLNASNWSSVNLLFAELQHRVMTFCLG
jgi:hypothetical protein